MIFKIEYIASLNRWKLCFKGFNICTYLNWWISFLLGKMWCIYYRFSILLCIIMIRDCLYIHAAISFIFAIGCGLARWVEDEAVFIFDLHLFFFFFIKVILHCLYHVFILATCTSSNAKDILFNIKDIIILPH